MAASTNSTHTLPSQNQSQSDANPSTSVEVAKNVHADVDNKETTATDASKLPVVVEASAESAEARFHDLETGECDAKARPNARVNTIQDLLQEFNSTFSSR